MTKKMISDEKLSQAISTYCKLTGWAVDTDPNTFFFKELAKVLDKEDILSGKLPSQKHLVALALKNKDLQRCFSEYAAKMLALELKDVFLTIEGDASFELEEDSFQAEWKAFEATLLPEQKKRCKQLFQLALASGASFP